MRNVRRHLGTIMKCTLRHWYYVFEGIIRVVLLAILIILELMEPYERDILPEEMWYYKYPFKPNTIPSYAMVLLSSGLPIAGIAILCLLRVSVRADYKDVIQGALGLSLAVLLNGIVTDTIKLTVGRPRPDFFDRCYPPGSDIPDVPDGHNCTGDKKDVLSGRKSFPSGHASWMFTGMVFFSLYLANKMSVFRRNGRGHSLRLIIVLVPIIAAMIVAITRLRDYWHHWEDITVGALMGTAFAILCYLQYFPSPFGAHLTFNNEQSNDIESSTTVLTVI
ncbi:phospholipid phosphatase 5-like [Dysidea avara]|uniref:phospholipid phosphatase 5-like n=1 Tax=Dysidea avara TaxID=196820 RepID=UPI003322D2A8